MWVDGSILFVNLTCFLNARKKDVITLRNLIRASRLATEQCNLDATQPTYHFLSETRREWKNHFFKGSS
jgi:hypothetical protein